MAPAQCLPVLVPLPVTMAFFCQVQAARLGEPGDDREDLKYFLIVLSQKRDPKLRWLPQGVASAGIKLQISAATYDYSSERSRLLFLPSWTRMSRS